MKANMFTKASHPEPLTQLEGSRGQPRSMPLAGDGQLVDRDESAFCKLTIDCERSAERVGQSADWRVAPPVHTSQSLTGEWLLLLILHSL